MRLSVNMWTNKYYYDDSNARLDGDNDMTSGFQNFFKRVLTKEYMAAKLKGEFIKEVLNKTKGENDEWQAG